MKVAIAVGLGLLALLGLVRWRRQRRAALLDALQGTMRELGMVVGLQATTSALEGIADGAIVLSVDGKRLELDLVEVLAVQEEPDVERRRQRLRWLVDQARIRQGV